MDSRAMLILPKILKILTIPKRPVPFLERGEKKPRLLKEDYHMKSEINPKDDFSSLLIPVVWNLGKGN